MRINLLYTSFALSYGLAVAHAQTGPPPVVRVYVEQVKPGKNAAHEKSESAWARLNTRVNFPAHNIALEAMAGGNEAWFVEAYNSFADVEKAEKVFSTEPMKSEFQQAVAMDGEYLSGLRSLIGVLRKDLTYDPEDAVTLSKTRYINVVTIRIKMGTEPRLLSTVNELIKLYKNVAMPQAVHVYQMISGAPVGTYLLFEPVASLADWDKYPAIMQSIRNTSRGKFEALEKEFADISTLQEGRLMSVNPRMSYVSREVIAGDPGFWAPKPKPAEEPKAAPGKRVAPRQTGQ